MSELMQYFSIINYSNITFSVNALGENIVRREWHYDSSCFLHSFVKLCVWVLFSPCTLVLPLNDDKPCYWETFKIIKDFRKMLCIWKIQLCFIIFSWCSSLFRSFGFWSCQRETLWVWFELTLDIFVAGEYFTRNTQCESPCFCHWVDCHQQCESDSTL